MSHYAIIENGIVINVVELDASALIATSSTDDSGNAIEIPALWCPPDGTIAIQNDAAGIGWSYQNGEFTAPVVDEPAQAIIPSVTLSELQQQLALLTQQLSALAAKGVT